MADKLSYTPANSSFGLYVNSGFSFSNLDNVSKHSNSRKSSRKSAVTGGVTGVNHFGKQSPRQAICDLLPSGVKQTEYKTWAQAWINRLSSASLADRITPSKYLPTSLPRHHTGQPHHHNTSISRQSAASHHHPRTAASSNSSISRKVDYRNLKNEAVGHPRSSQSPENYSILGSSLHCDVSRRAKSLPLLIDQRRILSKYATFTSPRSSSGQRINNNSNNNNNSVVSDAASREVTTTLLPATFRLVSETETPPKRAENYKRDSRKYITFCQPAGSAASNNYSMSRSLDLSGLDQLSPRLDNAFISVPLTESRSSSRLRSARGLATQGVTSEAPRNGVTSFNNVVTNTFPARSNLV